ncbi:hypothetical protein HYT51_00430 [Candidatus Woesearchaeota archaeon]|nr:hypothetical protein [Candidatus Woesearchaeota archaeon]
MANKQGISYSVVVGLLIALAIGVILILFTGGFSSLLSKGADRNACRNSVVLKVFNPTKIGELNCRTNYVEINTLDQQEIMQKVAEEAYWCWWQFKEGEADFIAEDVFAIKDKSWCFLCSDIQFSDKVKQKYPQGIPGFDTYLKETSLRPKYDGSYVDYLPKPYDTTTPDPSDVSTFSIIPTRNQFRIAFMAVESTGIRKDPTSGSWYFRVRPFGKYYTGILYSTEDIQNWCDNLRVGEPLS